MHDLLKDLDAKLKAVESEWIPPNCQSLKHFVQSAHAVLTALVKDATGKKIASPAAPAKIAAPAKTAATTDASPAK